MADVRFEERNNPIFDNLRQGINTVGQVSLTKQLKDQERVQAIRDAVKKAYLSNLFAGKIKQKTTGPVDIESILSGKTLPEFTNVNQTRPRTSISISERPYSEQQQARNVLERTPQDYAKAGMAKKTGGFGPWHWGGKTELSPQATAEQQAAQTILGSPRVTKRINYGSGDITNDTTSQLPDASQYEEGTTGQAVDGKIYTIQNGEWIESVEAE